MFKRSVDGLQWNFTWSENAVRAEENTAAHAATKFATVDPAVTPCQEKKN